MIYESHTDHLLKVINKLYLLYTRPVFCINKEGVIHIKTIWINEEAEKMYKEFVEEYNMFRVKFVNESVLINYGC